MTRISLAIVLVPGPLRNTKLTYCPGIAALTKKPEDSGYEISGGSRGGAWGAAPPPPSHLILDQTEAQRAEKIFLGDQPPPYLRVWMTATPPSTYLKVWIRHWRLPTVLSEEKKLAGHFFSYFMSLFRQGFSFSFEQFVSAEFGISNILPKLRIADRNWNRRRFELSVFCCKPKESWGRFKVQG